MNIRCPHCQTLFRVDPARVPARGIRARCARCSGTFQIAGTSAPTESPAGTAPPATHAPTVGTDAAARPADARPAQRPWPPATDAQRSEPAGTQPQAQDTRAPSTTPAAGTDAPQRPVFGSRDPSARAQRIARALVSDIVAYHPERRDRALDAGTLRSEFRDEIMKSWDEYVAQVGQETAKKTPHFRQALNDILASGQAVF